MTVKTFADIVQNSFRERRWEPEPRWHGGRFGYVVHRFPIKGGITGWDVISKNITKDNSLLTWLQKGRDDKPPRTP